jgi:hypothetical protein
MAEKEKYAGLFTVPATDGNFASGIGRLADEDLQAFYDALAEREAEEHCHKGRIKAVEKEMKARAAVSKEVLAVARMDEDIKAAEELYADGMPYELERIENEIRFYQGQAGSALLEMGKRLIRIKAHEGHGGFMKTLENLGVASRSANYAMAAARRFSNSPTLANLDSSKMKALSVLDDDEIENLERGATVHGMTLDAIGKMTMRELRENLRKEKDALRKEKEGRKKDRETAEAAIARLDQEVCELEQQLRYQQPPTKEQTALAAIMKLSEGYGYALAKINTAIREAHGIVAEAEKTPGAEYLMLNGWLNQFSGEMETFHALKDAWLDEVDNAAPIEVGKVMLGSDRAAAGGADVPELG